jgi:hypothetical protein
MAGPLVVIVGAGASHVSGGYAVEARPPLTSQLFAGSRADELLRIYSLAQEAGSAIQRAMKADTTIAFERALRDLQDDGYRHHRQMVLAVAPFLQALLLQYSNALQPYASRYGVLVDEILKLQTEVIFVSLNYDTLLDGKLASYSPLVGLDDYLETDYGWSLVKPHGSVAWYVEQPQPFDPKTPPPDMTVVRAPIKSEPVLGLTLARVRNSDEVAGHGTTRRYPALALPDGPKDELVWPVEQRQRLEGLLRYSPEIQLLVVGYSGLDTEILGLIARGRSKIRRMTVVNADGERALDVYDRILAAGIEPIWNDVREESFETWVDGSGLRNWAAEFHGRPELITEPDQLRQRVADVNVRRAASDMPGPESIMDRQF